MEERPVEMQAQFPVKPFHVDSVLDPETLRQFIDQLQKNEQPRPTEEKAQRLRRLKLARKELINHQRQVVRDAVANGTVGSLDTLSRRAKCNKSTARRLVRQQLSVNHIPDFDYNNVKSPEVAEDIMDMMTSEAGQYFSTSQVKQRMPGVSKKYIARTLKSRGFRYRKLRHTRPPRSFDLAEVTRVLSTALPAFDRDDESLLFLDEVIFPLNHTPTHCWRHKDDLFHGYKERTQCKSQLTCIALCSKVRAIAIQLHSGEMQAQAIIHFLTEVLKRHRLVDKAVVLLDNAKYHRANLVAQSSIGPYLLLSVPQCWELNMIEVLFSKAKALWKQRPVVRCADEEVGQVIRLFRECQKEEDFAGYRRQYLRNVLEALALSRNSDS